jgi:hypothetical protein
VSLRLLQGVDFPCRRLLWRDDSVEIALKVTGDGSQVTVYRYSIGPFFVA